MAFSVLSTPHPSVEPNQVTHAAIPVQFSMLMSFYFLCWAVTLADQHRTRQLISTGSASLPWPASKAQSATPFFTSPVKHGQACWPCVGYLTLHVLQRLGPWSMAPQEMKNMTQSGRFTLDRLWALVYWTAPPFTLPLDSGCSLSLSSQRSLDAFVLQIPTSKRSLPENSLLLFCPPTPMHPFLRFLLVDIGLYEKSIHLFRCKCSIFSRCCVIFVLL